LSTRNLIVNADDFGRSSSINTAVRRAHVEGILTTASLMVNEPASAEAVAIARDHPRLGVGLHLALILGRAALQRGRIPDLLNRHDVFHSNPFAVGVRYFARRGLRAQLRDEMQAQFDRFHATGLPLDHLNGHLHFHLHPVVFDLLMEHATEWGITRVRLTREPFWLTTRLASGRWLERAGLALVYHLLSHRAARILRRRGISHTRWVFGLLQDSRVDESYLLKLLPALPPGDSELYSHPSVDEFPHELAALVSPRVQAMVNELGLRCIRYADL